jgi:hypothetical protein
VGIAMIIQGILGLGFAVLNILFWSRVMSRGQERFRRRCERRYGVAITYGGKGHWQVSGGGPWYRRAAIEWLQLAYFIGVFVAWAIGIVAFVALLSLLD